MMGVLLAALDLASGLARMLRQPEALRDPYRANPETVVKIIKAANRPKFRAQAKLYLIDVDEPKSLLANAYTLALLLDL